MKVLVIIEHDNQSVKQSSFSTITAAKEISDSVEAIVLGQGLDSVINELKKSDHLKKIYKIDNELFKNPLAENLSNAIQKFAEGSGYTHILSPSSTFGKNMSPKLSALMDVQQISDITKIISDDTFERPIYAGNAIAKVKSSDQIKIITVRSTCFEPCALNSSVDVESLIVNIDKDNSVIKTLESINDKFSNSYQLYFANGGDQKNKSIPEIEVCKKLGIKLLEGLGEKIQSSSWLLNK